MKSTLKLFLWILFLAAVGAPAYYLYTRETEIDVTAMVIRRGRIEQTIAAFASGAVEPKQSSLVAAETLGKVVAIPVEEGMRVRAGDTLVVLDSTQQELQIAQAQTRLHQAQAALNLLRTQYEGDKSRIALLKKTRDIAAYEFKKDKRLLEEGDVGSQSMVNLSEINYNQIEDTYVNLNNLLGLYPLRIKEAEQGVKSMEIVMEQARIAKNWTAVKAPFDGLVAEVFVEVGESVGSGLGGAGSDSMLGGGLGAGGTVGGTGTPMLGGGVSMASPMAVARIVDDSDLYVKAPFDESTFGQVKTGQKVRLSIDAYPEEEFPGRVASVSSTVTSNLDRSRTFEVKILIEEGKERLIPGISADAIIVADEKEDVLFVPTEALIREEEGYVIENGRAVRRQVSVGIGNWMAKEVLDGLKEGELLVTSVSVRELRDGVNVRVVESVEEQ